MRKTSPAIIPVNYDYKTIMSPSSNNSIEQYDNQYTSLFGDPVPPPPIDFVENLDSHFYGNFRRTSIDNSTLITEFPKINTFSRPSYSALSSKIPISFKNYDHNEYNDQSRRSSYAESTATTNIIDQPKNITPPNFNKTDIRIQPPSTDSDGNSFLNFPAFSFLYPEKCKVVTDKYQSKSKNIVRSPRISSSRNLPFVGKNNESEKFSFNKKLPGSPRQSNISYEHSEWLKSSQDYYEWIKIPHLRPSSKNVMGVKQQKHSPVASMLHDSSNSNSSEEKFPLNYLNTNIRKSSSSRIPEIFPKDFNLLKEQKKRATSPVILTDKIMTGAEYRVETPRLHKKPSFTIITDKSSDLSGCTSPNVTGRNSPFLGRGCKNPTNISSVKQPQILQNQSKIHLPSIINSGGASIIEDFPRPSVQFNIASAPRRKSLVVSPMEKKNINSKFAKRNCSREKFISYDNLPLIGNEEIPQAPLRHSYQSSIDIYRRKHLKKRRPTTNPNPTSKERGLLSVVGSDIEFSSGIPIAINQSISISDLRPHPTHIPVHIKKNRSSSLSTDRRSSTQTYDRRSSNLSSMTTSDFSFRRNSIQSSFRGNNYRPFSHQPKKLTPHHLNVKTVKQNLNISRRVAKPTSLSPIIGTPNKDDDTKFSPYKNEFSSSTKIPLRYGSSGHSSKLSNRINSRSNSPTKIFAPVSRPNSRAMTISPSEPRSLPTSRSVSRTTSRPISRPASQATSRPTSRATSRQTSRATSRPSSRVATRSISRCSLQDHPRIISRAASSSTSRLNRKKSPTKMLMIRTKSKSASPQKTRRKLLSPTKSPPLNSKILRRDRIRGSAPTKSVSRNNSPPKSFSPIRHLTQSAKKTQSSPKKGVINMTKSSPTLQKKTFPSNKSPPKLKREPSSIKLSRQTSSLKLKNSQQPISSQDPTLKKKNSALKLDTTNINKKNETKMKEVSKKLIKTRTDSNLSKKLEKKQSFKNDKKLKGENNSQIDAIKPVENQENDEKLIPLTKANVVSMTTAAITAQPVQISTAVTNQASLIKSNSKDMLETGNLSETHSDNIKDMLPSSIIEKSQKTLETIQKTVTEATDEIHKTINENLTDLKTLESDIGKKIVEKPKSIDNKKKSVLKKTSSVKKFIESSSSKNETIVKSPGEPSSSSHNEINGKDMTKPEKSPLPPSQPIEASVSVLESKKSSENLLHTKRITASNNNNSTIDSSVKTINDGNGEEMTERVSERAISVLPEVECESANLQNFKTDKDDSHSNQNHKQEDNEYGKEMTTNMMTDINTGSSEYNNNKGSESQEYLDEEQPKGCCPKSKCSNCFSKLCLPCRRCRCCSCYSTKNSDSEIKSYASEINEKQSFWKKLKCCKTKNEIIKHNNEKKMETINEEPDIITQIESNGPKQGKCGLCLRKFFCCKATNKIDATSDDSIETTKCCFCIPCKKKIKKSNAWQTQETQPEVIESVERGCCTKFLRIICCKKKPPIQTGSRRTSTISKKQSLVPIEDNRPKLHIDLVEFNSKMKGAIPVMPLWIAWLCAFLNTVIPGLGTILSGFFCLCVGIPRFSQYDSFKARIGSFIINCFIGVAQFFCVIFCFVGWGWSIWWGTIMLKTARKLQKVRRVEELERQEDLRQAALKTAAAQEA